MKHYPALPHASLDSVFDGVWFVRGAVKMPMVLPMKFSRSMTVLRDDASGELTLINSIRLSEDGLKELDALGKVTKVIRIAGFHGRDDGFYREHYNAKLYAIQGQFYSRKMNAEKPAVSYLEPDAWLDESSELPITSARLKVFETAKPTEAVILLERDGGILVTGDSLQHTAAPDEFVNFPAKFMMKKMGFFQPHAVGPGWLQHAKPQADDVRSILELDFEHVLPGHGEAVIGGAKEKFRPQVEGPLKGCHTD